MHISGRVVIIILSIVIVCLVVCCLILSAFFANTAFLIRQRGTEYVCLTSQCLQDAARISRLLNTSINPCYDVYRFACGGWTWDNPVPYGYRHWNGLEKSRVETLERARRILEQPTPVAVPWNATVRKMRDYYKSCVSDSESEAHRMKSLKKLLWLIGGWGNKPGEVDFSNWLPTRFEINSALATSRFVLGTPAFFHVYVDVDAAHHHIPFIKIEEVSVRGCEMYDKRYRDYLRNIADTFHPKRSIEDFVDGIFSIYMRLCQLDFDKKNNIGRPREMNIKEIEKYLDARVINWYHFFNFRYRYDTGTKFVFTNGNMTLRYLKVIDIIAQEMSHSTLRDFFALRFMEENIFAMPKVIQDEYNHLLREYKEHKQCDYKKKCTARDWRHCIRYHVDDVMGLALIAALDEDLEYPIIGNIKVRTIAGSVRQAILRRLSKLEWLSADAKNIIQKRILTDAVMLGGPKWIKNRKKLDIFYEKLTVSNSSFLENYLRGEGFKDMVEAKMLEMKDQAIEFSLNFRYRRALMESEHSLENGYIGILPSTIQSPYFHQESEGYINYAGLGNIIGHTYGHHLDGKDASKWMDFTSLQHFNDRLQCATDYMKRIVYRTTGLTNVSFSQDDTPVRQLVADITGATFAFEAYADTVYHSEIETLQLPGLPYTTEQLFFIHLTQGLCMQGSGRDKNITPRQRVISAISQSEYFGEVFNCPKGSPMNPAKKCSIW